MEHINNIITNNNIYNAAYYNSIYCVDMDFNAPGLCIMTIKKNQEDFKK